MRRVIAILCLATLLAAMVIPSARGALPAILAPLWLFVAAIVLLVLLTPEALAPQRTLSFVPVFSSRPPPAL